MIGILKRQMLFLARMTAKGSSDLYQSCFARRLKASGPIWTKISIHDTKD